MPGALGWGLVGGSAVSSVLLRRLIEGGIELPAVLSHLRRQAGAPSSKGATPVLLGVS
jgi:hypothetical protein